jgi:hypothetical protein
MIDIITIDDDGRVVERRELYTEHQTCREQYNAAYHHPLKGAHGKDVNICYCGKTWPHDTVKADRAEPLGDRIFIRPD